MRQISFTGRGNNLFSWAKSDGSTKQLTNLSAEKPPAEEKNTGKGRMAQERPAGYFRRTG
jgi:hypothetical protein